MNFLTPEEENVFNAIVDGSIYDVLDGIEITQDLNNILHTPLENPKPYHHEKSIHVRFDSDYCKL